MTDDRELYEEITAYLISCQREDLGKLRFYENDLLTMVKMYSLEHQLEQALSERIWLNSGGYLVIQPTEALTVIDVNTGKYEGGKKKEAAFLKINLEAALEAARQIRLRNLSGIIIIDFINMESEESVDLLLSRLREALRTDPIQTTLVDMTRLSLVEITRKKVSKTLAESCR
jgi:ribonuclease G